MNKLKLHMYSDPSHGWLKINLAQLFFAGIKNEISNYSYMRKSKTGSLFIYLEEDGDATLFINAMKLQGIPLQIVEHTSNNSSAIRNYSSYNSNNIGK